MAATQAGSAGLATGSAHRTPFPRNFWAINAVEVLERTAYYGALAVASLRMADQGLSPAQIGSILGLLLPLPFLIPLVSSSLAERFGYKPMLLVAYAFYATGFVLLANAGSYAANLVAVIFLGTGSGTFKPVPAATIGIVSPPERTKQGYSYYYAAINIGGLAGPLLAGLVVFLFSDCDLATARTAMLYVCVGAILLAALVTLVLFRNPRPRDPSVGVISGFKRFGPGLRDRRFMALLVIFSGFWMLYSMNFSFLSLYIEDFVPLPPWFTAEMQNVVNPLVIVVVGVPLGLAADKMKGFAAMTLGIALFAAGFALVGFTQAFVFLVGGLVIATLGEILAYPGFLAHVAKVAGPERASAYQSLGFLPVGLGFFVGPYLGGPLYSRFVEDQARPELFWAIMVCIAIATLAAMLAYDHMLRPLEERRRRRAGVVAAFVLVLLLVPAMLVTASRLDPTEPQGEDALVIPPGRGLAGSNQYVVVEGAPQTIQYSVPPDANGTWTLDFAFTDEASGSGTTNQPDTFQVRVLDAAGEPVADGSGAASVATADTNAGNIQFTIPLAPLAGTTVSVEVTLTEAGDQSVLLPFGGPATVAPDQSNRYEVATAVDAEPAEDC